MRSPVPLFLLCVGAALASACAPLQPSEGENEGEVITTVELTFTPQTGGAALVFAFADPENDGDPVVDDVVLADVDNYDLAVRFLNELADPAEDITDEVRDEGADHQVFFYGSAVAGPAAGAAAAAVITHAYADDDGNGLPVGLLSTVITEGVGSGELSVLLRHMPPENDTALKVDSVSADFAADGEAGIGGSTDVDVTFALSVE